MLVVMDARKDCRAATAGSIAYYTAAARVLAGVVSDGGGARRGCIGRAGYARLFLRGFRPTNLNLPRPIDINVSILAVMQQSFLGRCDAGCGDGVWLPAHLADASPDVMQRMKL